MLTALMIAAVLAQPPVDGVWNATLDSPGGDLTFGLEFDDGGRRAFIINGQERLQVPSVAVDGDAVLLRFDHYDSEIRASWQGDQLVGQWTKVGARGKQTTLAFRADRRQATRIEPVDRTPLEARHRVRFESSDDPAVLLIEYEDATGPTGDSTVIATFMTTTGDYRFLSGRLVDLGLTLSVFDGAHAFLFKATLTDDGGFEGDFWSRDTWHETWTSTPDPDAHLPDAFAQTTWNDGATLDDLVFSDLDGAPTPVASLREPDQPMIIKVFGTWCPNCHDAGQYLSELAGRYPEIAFVGLAFEHTSDHERSVRQVRAYAHLHEIQFPILVAGLSDKSRATEQLRVLDRVRSFPTTIFIDRAGRVRAVHSGFAGPATGRAYDELRAEFERLIDEISR